MASKQASKVYAFHSLGDLVDELGFLKAKIADLTEHEAEAKAEFIRRRVKEAEGKKFRATRSSHKRESLDVGLIRDEFGDDWIKEHSRTRTVVSVRVSARRRKR